jgi:hypothetical protein
VNTRTPVASLTERERTSLLREMPPREQVRHTLPSSPLMLAVEQILSERTTRGQAEALRAAAAAIEAHPNGDIPKWLRFRADRIEAAAR